MAMSKPWNPMEDAFKNKEFNKYQRGPGADLDDDLQPGAVAAGGANRKKFRLCLKNVPKEMTPKAVHNLCANYGKVLEIHNPSSTPYLFVCFATLNDMERTYTGLKDNPHGIVAELAREKTEQNNQNSGNLMNSSRGSRDENKIPPNYNQVDMSKRTIKGPFTNPPRPVPMQKKPLVTHNDYETSNLKNVDPQKHFLIQNDMYDNDRSNHRRPDNANQSGGKQFHTGRAYYTDSKETTDKIKQLSESSRGSYNSEKNTYVKESFNNSLNEQAVGNCILCAKMASKVCQRCGDYYCSFECQKRDWPKHRYICFQMPNLVPPNRNDIGVEVPSKAPNLTNSFKPNNHDRRSEGQSFKQNCTETIQDTNKQFQRNSTNIEKKNADYPKKQFQQPPPEKKNTTAPPPPKADERKPSVQDRKDTAITSAEIPKSGSIVSLTAFSKSNFVYIRSMAPEDNLDYVKGLNIVNNVWKKTKIIEKMPQRGDLLLSEFQGTGFYRVLVLNVESAEEITVVYIDFGNIEKKKMTELKDITPEAIALKRYAVPVRLKGVPDFKPNDKIMAYLTSFLDAAGKDLKIVYEGQPDMAEVELIDISSNENLNKKILELRDVQVPKDSDAPVMNTDVELKLLPDGEKVPVFVFDNSLVQTGYISCIHEKDVLTLESFNQEIKQYAEKSSEPYTPRENELCLVKYEEDGVWYRAECIEVVGDGNPSVLFMDYGNVTTSPIENIRKYPKEFTQPCLTSSCMIDGLPEDMDAKTANRLKELIPINERITLDKVVSVKEDDINIIYMPKVIQTLKSENLIP